MSAIVGRLKQWAGRLKRETYALYLAARHPDTPWYAKTAAAAVAAYALSPIDLIPDFVPVLGYLDDLLLLPIGIAIAVRLVPGDVLSECRAAADVAFANEKPVSRLAGAIIGVIWIAAAAMLLSWILKAIP